MAGIVGDDVFGPRIDGRLKHLLVAAGRRRIDDLADAREVERHRAWFAQAAAMLGEIGAHGARGAVAVVGQRLHDDGHAARAIALVAGRLVGFGLAAFGLLDRPLDIVLGHVFGPGALDRQAQTCIHVGVRTAVLG